MDKIIQLIAESKEPLAIIGLISIGLVNHTDNTIVAGVIGALAGIIVGKKS